jgi:hypothetical protein
MWSFNSLLPTCLGGMVLTHRYSSVLKVKPDTVVKFSGSGDNAPFYLSARTELPTGIRHFSMLYCKVYMEHSQMSKHDLPEIFTLLNFISLMGSGVGKSGRSVTLNTPYIIPSLRKSRDRLYRCLLGIRGKTFMLPLHCMEPLHFIHEVKHS